MKTTRLIDTFKALAIIASLVIAGAHQAQAGETSVYFKSGWFNWEETVNGNSFVKEKGFLYGAGVARKDTMSALTIAEVIEVWGGDLDYDGHDLTGSRQIKSDTSYLGTKEEVALSLEIPAGSALSFDPFAALGHKFWIRTRSSEDWNSFYAKAGLAAELKTASCTLFVKGGAMAPIYTRTHVSLSNAGYTDVVVKPKSRVSAFAEGGVRMGDFAASIEYEGMKFGESAKVATNRTAGVGKGAVIVGAQAYQPESESSFVSLKLTYSF